MTHAYGLKTAVLGVCVSVSLMGNAIAQETTSSSPADDAALCNTVLAMKAGETGLSPKEAISYQTAADWFAEMGTEADSDAYEAKKPQYADAFETAMEDGEAEYPRAVTGCMAYYETQNVE